MPRIPIVIVLGATGTGKSALAVKIAKKFRGEIISADSMQVYIGLNVVSNKITEPEKEGIPHYLLDVCKPTDRFSVLDFRNRALDIIEDIRRRGKLPIIVGGTTYYIESVLWNTLIEAAPEKSTDELVFHRCRVLNDSEVLRADRWRTNNQKELNSIVEEVDLQNINARVAHQYSHLSLADDIDQLCGDIVRVEKMFEELIRDTVSRLRLDFNLYRRTFYRASEFRSQVNIQKSDVGIPPVRSSDTEEIVERLSVETVTETEARLLNQFLLAVSERFVSFLKETCSSEDESTNVAPCTEHQNSFIIDPSFVWNEKNMFNMVTCSRGSRIPCQGNVDVPLRSTTCNAMNNDIDVRDQREKLLKAASNLYSFSHESNQSIEVIKKCREMMNEMRNVIFDATNTRLKRLALLRVIDDENMIDYDTEDLHSELKLFDSETANNLHPNDRRKIIRAIQLFLSTGKTVKQLRSEQHRQPFGDGNTLDEHGLSLRYPDALVLWLRCDQDTLNERLAKRVDEMLSSSLIGELETFHEQYNLSRLNHDRKADYTKGIFQLIGLKEFHSYLVLSAEDKKSEVGRKKLRSSVERLKRTNIQYSKSQCRHILNKFINVPHYKQVPPLFEVDCTNPPTEQEEIDMKALTLVEKYLEKGTDEWWLPYTPVTRLSADLRRFSRGEFFCNPCQRLFTNQFQLSIHNMSRSHKRHVYKQKKNNLHRRMAALSRPNASRSDPEEDISFNDSLWEEWDLN